MRRVRVVVGYIVTMVRFEFYIYKYRDIIPAGIAFQQSLPEGDLFRQICRHFIQIDR